MAESRIRTIPDFPKPGIKFRDITPMLADPHAFNVVVDALIERVPADVTAVCGIESRGFIFAAPMATRMSVGFVPIRKPGKLPGTVVEEAFDLEYGSSTLAMHTDALTASDRVVIIDDLLATGGTLGAAIKLVERVGASVAGIQVVLELAGLGGRETLQNAGIEQYSTLFLIDD